MPFESKGTHPITRVTKGYPSDCPCNKGDAVELDVNFLDVNSGNVIIRMIPQANMTFCTHCGTEILDSAKFCIGCGTKVAPEEEVSQEIAEITEDTISDEGRVSFDLNPYSNQSFALVVVATLLSINSAIPILSYGGLRAKYLVYIVLISLILAYMLILFGVKLSALFERIFRGFQTQILQIFRQGLLFSLFCFLSFITLVLNHLLSSLLIFEGVGQYNMTNFFLLTPIIVSGVLMFASRDYLSPNREDMSNHSEE